MKTPAVVQEEHAQEVDRVSRVGNRAKNREVPEEDLQQQRNVADHLDVDVGELGDHPVVGKPRNADDETDDRCKQHPDERHQESVEDAHDERAAVTRRLAIGDQRLDDAETGCVFEKSETGGDVLLFQVARRVGDDFPTQPDDHRNEDDLVEDTPNLGVVDQRGLRRLLADGFLYSHSPSARCFQTACVTR